MIIMSLNIRGLGSARKSLVLWHFIGVNDPSIILLQEMMMIGHKIWPILLLICPKWWVCVVDALGLLGGLTNFWDHKVMNFLVYKSFAGILLPDFIRGSKENFNILNTYVPYSSRRYFHDKFESCVLLNIGSLILAGDLNLTIKGNEGCGGHCRVDPLATYFNDIFGRNHLADIFLAPFIPTWINGWVGSIGIAKRIDCFMLHENLVECLGFVKPLVIPSQILDHYPIILEWHVDGDWGGLSFKFNHHFLKFLEFDSLVCTFWALGSDPLIASSLEIIRINFRALKKCVDN